jgi:hypothetical protein
MPLSQQGPLDRCRPVLSQRAVVSQFSTKCQNAVFHRPSSSIRRAGTTLIAIREVDIAQAPAARSVYPSLNRTEAYLKLPGYLTEGLSLSDCGYHLASPVLLVCFCLMSLLSGGFFHHCTDLRLLTLY